MAQITRRRISDEHMDDPAATREQMAEALRFIRMVNRRLGGSAAAVREVARMAEGKAKVRGQRSEVGGGSLEPFRILDVGTGAADIPVAIAQWARRVGRRVEITAVDLHPVTLELAREFVAQSGCEDVISLEQGDALKLMERFEPGEFDIAHAGTFLHHLQDIDVMTVLRIMDRLTTRGIIWNDLQRGVVGHIGAWLMTLGVPAHLKHDARVSVSAGFTKREAMDLAKRVGLRNVRIRSWLMHRFTLTAEK